MALLSLGALLFTLTACSVVFAGVSAYSMATNGVSVMLLFGFEYLGLLVTALAIAGELGLL